MNSRALGVAFVVCLLVGFAPARVAAQSAPAAPDLVRLRDGGLLRGTIAELLPGDHVTLVLLTGETRRVAASDFSFAGPADEAPRVVASGATTIPAPPSTDTTPPTNAATPTTPTDASAPPAGGARVRFRGDDGERIVVDAASETRGTAGFTRVCTTPCSLVMPIGTYHVALTASGKPRLTVEHLVPIEDRDLVTVEYETRGGTRAGGIVVIGLTGALGLGVGLSPLAIDARARDGAILPAIIGGVAVAALGTLIGLLMHGSDDAAHSVVTHQEDRSEDDSSDDSDD